MEHAHIRRQMAECAQRLFESGHMTPLGGNLSVRLREASSFLITPSGVHKATLRPESMVEVDGDGRFLGGRPSEEWRVHMAVYRTSPNVGAVIHTHSPYALTCTTLGVPIMTVTTSSELLPPIRRIPKVPPGSQDLADLTALQVPGACVAILEGHGVLAFTEDLDRAEEVVFCLENAARMSLMARLLGMGQALDCSGAAPE